MESNCKINVKTEEIINEIDTIYGASKCKEVIRNYASYIEMKKAGEIDFGNYNILIRNKSEYEYYEKVIEIIWKILKSNDMINTSYRCLERDVIRKSGVKNDFTTLKDIEEQLLIIDTKKMDISINLYRSEIKEVLEKFPEKIFIIVDSDENEGLINASMGNSLTWTMRIERISKDDKVDYVNKFLKTTKISVDNRSTFIDCISNEPFWKVKDELLNIVLECKLKGITVINDEIIKEELKKDYYKEHLPKAINKNAIKELNSMIGMKDVKEQINKIINFIKINSKRGKMPSLHMCFLGNPGTGKTTVARLVGRIFSEMNILSDKEVFIEAQRSDLIGEYVGQTAPLTKKVIDKANGGVLFIDEAYSIASYIQDEAGRDYGAECIATLIKEMEDKRDNLCVILAGYSKEMEHMLNVNPGFESRIQFKINFPDYSEEELYEIFKKMTKKENYKISSNVKKLLIQYFEAEKKTENFSNARCVRNIFEKTKFEQASRISKNKNDDINLIKKEDVENVIKKIPRKEEKKRIGF